MITIVNNSCKSPIATWLSLKNGGSGFKSLWHHAPNMDALVALGSAAAFVYSTFALFAMTDAQVKGNADAVMSYMHEFYFESAATILTLITLGKMLEAHQKEIPMPALYLSDLPQPPMVERIRIIFS